MATAMQEDELDTISPKKGTRMPGCLTAVDRCNVLQQAFTFIIRCMKSKPGEHPRLPVCLQHMGQGKTTLAFLLRWWMGKLSELFSLGVEAFLQQSYPQLYPKDEVNELCNFLYEEYAQDPDLLDRLARARFVYVDLKNAHRPPSHHATSNNVEHAMAQSFYEAIHGSLDGFRADVQNTPKKVVADTGDSMLVMFVDEVGVVEELSTEYFPNELKGEVLGVPKSRLWRHYYLEENVWGPLLSDHSVVFLAGTSHALTLLHQGLLRQDNITSRRDLLHLTLSPLSYDASREALRVTECDGKSLLDWLGGESALQILHAEFGGIPLALYECANYVADQGVPADWKEALYNYNRGVGLHLRERSRLQRLRTLPRHLQDILLSVVVVTARIKKGGMKGVLYTDKAKGPDGHDVSILYWIEALGLYIERHEDGFIPVMPPYFLRQLQCDDTVFPSFIEFVAHASNYIDRGEMLELPCLNGLCTLVGRGAAKQETYSEALPFLADIPQLQDVTVPSCPESLLQPLPKLVSKGGRRDPDQALEAPNPRSVTINIEDWGRVHPRIPNGIVGHFGPKSRSADLIHLAPGVDVDLQVKNTVVGPAMIQREIEKVLDTRRDDNHLVVVFAARQYSQRLQRYVWEQQSVAWRTGRYSLNTDGSLVIDDQREPPVKRRRTTRPRRVPEKYVDCTWLRRFHVDPTEGEEEEGDTSEFDPGQTPGGYVIVPENTTVVLLGRAGLELLIGEEYVAALLDDTLTDVISKHLKVEPAEKYQGLQAVCIEYVDHKLQSGHWEVLDLTEDDVTRFKKFYHDDTSVETLVSVAERDATLEAVEKDWKRKGLDKFVPVASDILEELRRRRVSAPGTH